MLAVGDPAPPFDLVADDGSTVRLADLKGRRAVVFFYPRDDTPGCTRQACALRDDHPSFEREGATVLGIAPGTAESHARFREKYSLPFRLLVDPDHAVAEAWGVWGEKMRYGKTSMGIRRSSFTIDEEGRILDAAYDVKPETTSPRALAALAG